MQPVTWVEMQIPPHPGEEKWIDADVNGDWDFKINKPNRMSVRAVEKDGYAFDRSVLPSNMQELIWKTSKKTSANNCTQKKSTSISSS